MKKDNIDVLNLEWTSYPSRDRNVATLVNNYLRLCGLRVSCGSVFEGFHLIDVLKPRLLFITNATGALINYQLVKYAKIKGIKVLTLVSEGNFQESNIEQFVWGWNYERMMYEDYNIQWSNRTREMSISHYPYLESKIKVSGSVGLDAYNIFPKLQKSDFLIKHNKSKYSKVIGVGCWDFGILYPSDPRYILFQNIFSDSDIARFKEDQLSFNSILLEVIKANPNILFLLKEHPGNTADLDMSGIDKTDSYDNVLILKKESIVDCIAISDFWLTYESTTVIEAWMFGKQTGLINPSGVDFPRSNVYLGSPNFDSVESLQKAIDGFYNNNNIYGFDNLKLERLRVLSEFSLWHDGYNHVRVGNEIIALLGDNNYNSFQKNKYSYDFNILAHKIKQWLYPRLPYFNTHSYISKKLSEFNHDELINYEERVMNYQKEFYRNSDYSIEDLSQFKCI